MAMSLTRLKSKRYSTGLLKKAARYSGDLYGSTEKLKKPTKEETENVERLKVRLALLGIKQPDDRIRSVLHGKYANGNLKRAEDLLALWDKTSIGIIEQVNPEVEMLGAENNGKVTCYLDSLLFALYARLDSFEPMLCNDYDDEKQKKLSALLRMFVNMLRTGMLVTTDLMQQIQDCLAECGWKDAGKTEQQDASEAFSFIAEKLEAPLLTLKMDIAHGGKDTPEDDHKFINERLLNVALPTEPDSLGGVSLLPVLESYFNNRVDVQRHLELAQPLGSDPALVSASTVELPSDEKPIASLHIEYTDLGSVPASPSSPSPFTPLRERAPSILRSVNWDVGARDGEEKINDIQGRKRSTSRKEITIPAWQFFSILPFYTDSTSSKDKPTTISKFANHFSSKRPTIGLCLKRYSWTNKNVPVRNGIDVRIPTEIDLPHFVDDEDMENPGHFRLTLQSAVCHRGTSVNSGHYVALIRGNEDKWLLFDDLAPKRVREVDQAATLRTESPYLLFYQMEMIEDLPHNSDDGSVRSSLDTKRSMSSTEIITQSSPDILPTIDIPESSSPILMTPEALQEVTTKLSHVSTEPLLTVTSDESLRPDSRADPPRYTSAPGSKSTSRSASKGAENRLSFGLARLTTKRNSHEQESSPLEAFDIRSKDKKGKKRDRSKSKGRHKDGEDDKDCIIS